MDDARHLERGPSPVRPVPPPPGESPRPTADPKTGAVPIDPLFEEFRAGSREAIRIATSVAGRVIAHRAQRIPPENRRDLIQDVLTELWHRTHEPGFASERAFDAFVRSLAYWRAVDHVRQAGRELPEERGQTDAAPLPEEWYLDRERRRLGHAVVRRMREPCRELFQLHAAEGLSYREISERLGRSEGALRVQMHGCLKQARKLLEQLTRWGTGRSGRR